MAKNEKGPSTFPEESKNKPPKLSWPRLVLAGMSATVLLVVLVLGIYIVTNPQEGSPYPLGSGTAQVSTAKTLVPTIKPLPFTKVTLTIKGAGFDNSQIEATRQVLVSRVQTLGVTLVNSGVTNNQITLELRDIKDQDLIKKVLSSTGRVEFVDAGSEFLQDGTLVETTYCSGGTLLNPQAGQCDNTSQQSTPGSTTPAVTEGGKPFQTIITGEDLDQSSISVKPTSNQYDALNFKIKTDGAAVMKNFTTLNSGHQMAVVQDNRVIFCAAIRGIIADAGEITTASKLDFNTVATVLKSGPLPLSVMIASWS